MSRILISLTFLTVASAFAQVRIPGPGGVPTGTHGTWGVDFRTTSTYVTDPTNYTYSLGETYPTSRTPVGQGSNITFGFNTNTTGDTRDRNSSNDPRLAGIALLSVASSCASYGSNYFRFDLPNGAGTYTVNLAAGDPNGAQTQNFVICDGSTTKETYSAVSTAANSFMDATGTVLTETNWVSGNTGVSITFSGISMYLVPTNGSTFTTLSNVSVTQ